MIFERCQRSEKAPEVVTDPVEIYQGQGLVTFRSFEGGASLKIAERSYGDIGFIFSWPVTYFSNFDVVDGLGNPLAEGDELIVQHELCELATPTRLPPVRACSELSTSEIITPLAGDSFVIIYEAVDGATIRVWDGSEEIGDGSGSVIYLSRALVDGETITVTQEIGRCVSESAFSIRVQNPK